MNGPPLSHYDHYLRRINGDILIIWLAGSIRSKEMNTNEALLGTHANSVA
jgi:hypothetical protein